MTESEARGMAGSLAADVDRERRAALALTRLDALMALASAGEHQAVAVIDGPVPSGVTPGLVSLPESENVGADPTSGKHAAQVASILSCIDQGTGWHGICPRVQLISVPVLRWSERWQVPIASTQDLATAIYRSVQEGATVINLSVGLFHPSSRDDAALREALDYAEMLNALVIVAAGNQGMLGGSTLTRHPCVIPVTACNLDGEPWGGSNLSRSIAVNGVMSPPLSTEWTEGFGGTSLAAPVVSGAAVLLRSIFSLAPNWVIRHALRGRATDRKRVIVAPLLDAWRAYEIMTAFQGG